MSTHAALKNLFTVPRSFCSTQRPHAPEGCGETIPTRTPGRPTAREKPVYRSPLTDILTATAQLLAESFRLLPLEGCRTRLLRAWPHTLLWARRCPPAKHPFGSWVCCVQCHCKYVVSCCCLCVPSSFLIRAWDRQWWNSHYWHFNLFNVLIAKCLRATELIRFLFWKRPLKI